MTVNPGLGGQKLIPGVLESIRYLRKEFPKLGIMIDGGISYLGEEPTAKQAARKGANLFVAGSAIIDPKYKDENYKTPIRKIRESIE